MNRSSLISILAAATALSAAAAPAAASAKRVPNCDTKRQVSDISYVHRHKVKHYKPYVTAKATKQVRVYSTVGDDFGSIYYACWRKTGRSHRLAVNTGGAQVYDAYVRHLQIKGRFVGFTYDARGDEPNNYDEFVVVDASTGKRIRDVKTPKSPTDPEGTFTLTSSGGIG